MGSRKRRGQPRRNAKRAGFSSPGFKPFWDLLLNDAGIRGREKRQYFNQVGSIMVLSSAFGAAFFGYSLFGGVGFLIGLVVGLGWMGKYATKNRFIR